VKRSAIDVLRRGLDDTIANWPLILIRLGEALLFAVIAVVAVVAILVPLVVSVGVSLASLATPEDVENLLLSLMGKWALLVWVVAGVSLLLVIFVAIHSFVEAGCARVYVDAERQAGPADEGPRSRFRTFTMERWMAGGAAGWWSVFWIYNLAWGLAGLLFLIPLVPTALLMLLFREQPELMAGTGCLGLIVTLVMMIVIGIITGMWTNRAIVDWAAHDTGAAASLSGAWRAFRADLGRHILVAAAAIVIAMAGSSFFAGFSIFASFGEAIDRHGLASLITLPIRLLTSLASTALSAAITSWYVAAYAALTVER
jgi:hypothetical protein